MKVSLILATLGRIEDVRIFFESLVNQTYKNFEVIVVDQNVEDVLDDIVEKYSKIFEIKHIRSDIKGISVNRNKGLFYASGEIVAFPDDDCEYKEDTIEKAVKYLYDKPKTIYSCRTLERGKNYGTGVMATEDCDISVGNVELTIKSITFFVNIKGEVVLLFDTKLGVGAQFGSGEETDYVLELLNRGYKGRYFSCDVVYHPAKKGNYTDLDRAYKYAMGYGALCKKEITKRNEPGYYLIYIYKLIRNIGGMILTKNRMYHYTVLKGRIRGFLEYD